MLKIVYLKNENLLISFPLINAICSLQIDQTRDHYFTMFDIYVEPYKPQLRVTTFLNVRPLLRKVLADTSMNLYQ